MKRAKGTESFFKKLFVACHHNDAFSIMEICQYFGVSYQEAREWAENERYTTILEACHRRCESNIEIAELKARISIAEAFSYRYENDALQEIYQSILTK